MTPKMTASGARNGCLYTVNSSGKPLVDRWQGLDINHLYRPTIHYHFTTIFLSIHHQHTIKIPLSFNIPSTL